MKVSRKWYSAAFGTTLLVMLVSCIGVTGSAMAKPAHHHKQPTHKHKRKPHHHKKSTECVLVVNGEKTVTRGKCPPVSTEPQPAPSDSCKQVIEGKETNLCQPQEIEHSCEHNPLPGECVIHCVMGVEISPGQCTGPIIQYPIEVCEASDAPGPPEFPCGEPLKEESPCATKICEPLPEEECPEEQQEVAGPKG